MLLSMSATLLALALFAVLVVSFEIASIFRNRERELASIASLVSYNVQAPLAFGDTAAASETLAGLSNQSFILAAAALLPDGTLLGSYRKAPDTELPLYSAGLRAGLRYQGLSATSVREVTLTGQRVGWLLIRASFSEIYSIIVIEFILAAAVLAGCLLVSFAAMRFMERIITGPLDHLLSMVRSIAGKKDYSLRLTEDRRDEFGTLIAQFNRMLQEIEYRENSLEETVAARTEELSQALVAARAADKAKDEFVAHMSHEMRTPLNGILGLAGLMLDSPLNEEQQNMLHSINISGRNLLTVVNEILDYSRMSADKLELERYDFELTECLDGAMRSCEFGLRDRELELVTWLSPDLPARLLGDETRLRQVLINLLGNSVKFSHRQGGVVIYIEPLSVTSDEIEVHFVVSDTGIGIPAEKQSRIFEPFAQADSSMARNYGGTGLGLSICERIVRLMGGRIWVRSRKELGSAFHFTARFGVAAAQVLGSHDVSQPDGKPDPRLRVLVAEDNAINRAVVEKLLSRHGHSVTIAENGREAVERSAADSFDLILMDIQMPVLDGIQATAAIREREKQAGGHVPIIALTAHAMPGEREHFLELGMDGYVSKPIQPKDFFQAIRDLTEAHRIH